jgi:hypothetical protein
MTCAHPFGSARKLTTAHGIATDPAPLLRATYELLALADRIRTHVPTPMRLWPANGASCFWLNPAARRLAGRAQPALRPPPSNRPLIRLHQGQLPPLIVTAGDDVHPRPSVDVRTQRDRNNPGQPPRPQHGHLREGHSRRRVHIETSTTPLECRQPSSRGADYRPVTAEPSDKPVTNGLWPDRHHRRSGP